MYSRRLGCYQVEKLMDQFRSILNKKKSESGGDSIEDATDKWKFYDRMSFLKEFISKTVSYKDDLIPITL